MERQEKGKDLYNLKKKKNKKQKHRMAKRWHTCNHLRLHYSVNKEKPPH